MVLNEHDIVNSFLQLKGVFLAHCNVAEAPVEAHHTRQAVIARHPRQSTHQTAKAVGGACGR